jgi:hypothetical protein
MKKSTHITFTTVVGSQGTDMDLSYQSNERITIGCGSLTDGMDYNYTVVTDGDMLDELMAREGITTTYVAPRQIYAKHIWKANIECLPPFEELRDYDFDPTTVSAQQVALALSCWIGTPSVFLLGYQLEPLKETPALQAFSRIYPNTKFAYIRKPNPQKINLFRDHGNVVIDDTLNFQRMIKDVVKA